MSNKKDPELEWYQVLIILTGSLGIALALFHWLKNGVDIPNGILTILSLIISAALGPNAVSTIKKTWTKPNPYTDTNPDTSADAGLYRELYEQTNAELNKEINAQKSKESKPPPGSMSELMEDKDAK